MSLVVAPLRHRIKDSFWKTVSKSPNYENVVLGCGGIGALGGAIYPAYMSQERDPFIDCVAQTGSGAIQGAFLGFIAGMVYPAAAVGLVLGGPMWAYQRMRFPAKPAPVENWKTETRVGDVLVWRSRG